MDVLHERVAGLDVHKKGRRRVCSQAGVWPAAGE
jgi:hypothetical protein